MSVRPRRKRRAVLPWPGPSLVLVRSVGGRHAVMLSKPGDVTPTFQCRHPTLAEAITDACDRAQACGWRYVGVRDEAHARRVASFRHQPDEDEDVV